MKYQLTLDEAAQALMSLYGIDVTSEQYIESEQQTQLDITPQKTPTGRAKGQGRKAKSIHHIFPYINPITPPLWFDDAITGIQASFLEKKQGFQNYVCTQRVIQVLNSLTEITSKAIEEELTCSSKTARRYMEVITLLIQISKIEDYEYINCNRIDEIWFYETDAVIAA